MKILMVGSGGREHALIRKLKESHKVDEVICAPGNGGISLDVKCFPISAMDIDAMLELAKSEKVDMVFVAPDDPLAAGMVDAFEKSGIGAFGPSADAARIEASKVFSKNLMKKYGIPTAAYEIFENPNDVLKFIKSENVYPTVIKADGLALGKGVVIAENYDQAEKAVSSIMEDKIFGKSGNRVVVEEFLTGPEVSILSFCDGKNIVPMVSSMDHKRALDGDNGPNTGGMGTVSPNLFYTSEIADRCMKEIFVPTVNAMIQEGCPFKGCLYFGLILTEDGPKVIEYNARFGDPEAQVVLPRLKTDLFDIINAVIDETLDNLSIEWDDGAAACVILASRGYPGNYIKGIEIKGLGTDGQLENATVYHAGTNIKDGKLVTSGGRVVGISTKGKNIDEALAKAYKALNDISFDGMQYRKDIGKKK